MLGPALLKFGSEEQKKEHLTKITAGEIRWAQGYSEPNAGSDLASLMTKCEDKGDHYLINGQKIWTSYGDLGDMIFVLVRTDFEAKKHEGISFVLVDMDQPGVEARPIKLISGKSPFCETFFTDARAAKEHVIGGVNNGWAVAMSLLGYERGEAAATMPVMFRGEYDRLLALARDRGRTDDPTIRQRLAQGYIEVEIMRLLGMRTLTGFLAGKQPGPGESAFKLYWSEYHQRITELSLDILGAEAMVPEGPAPTSAFHTDNPGAPNQSASWIGTFYNARAGTIYAGTSQVQRNILGEMVLGLPKEPKPKS